MSGIKVTECPCGKGEYPQCCGRYHAGILAPDPESLMRSRYSAYVLQLEDYLLATWHPSTRPATVLDEAPVKWLGLTVRSASTDGDAGVVDFVARYKVNGRAYRLEEISRFVREDGHWLYVDGDLKN